MIRNLHLADVNVKVVLPTGPGDFILISVTPGHAHVNEPKSESSTITWHLSGAPPSITGLEFPSNGIEMVQPPWDPAWGVPTKVDADTYVLDVLDGPPPEVPFKYTLRVQWDGGSAQIDPEIEFDPE
jgi:hypothetical protein